MYPESNGRPKRHGSVIFRPEDPAAPPRLVAPLAGEHGLAVHLKSLKLVPSYEVSDISFQGGASAGALLLSSDGIMLRVDAEAGYPLTYDIASGEIEEVSEYLICKRWSLIDETAEASAKPYFTFHV